MHRFSIAAIALTAVLSFVPAVAGPASIVVSASAPTDSGINQMKAMTVAFGDLDVATSQGATTLFDRIDAASRVVCGERQGKTMGWSRAKVFASCRAQTTAAAVKAVGAPQLTQLAAAH